MRGITILGVLFLVGCHCPRVEVRYVPRPQRAARETTEGPTILSFQDWLTTQPWGPTLLAQYEDYVHDEWLLRGLARYLRDELTAADLGFSAEPPPDRPVDSGVVEHSGQEPETDLP